MIPESYGIERVEISALTAFSGNPRTHSDTQIDQIAASIREFGWTNPILVDAGGTIIAGHGRLAAATRLGLTEVPVIRLGHLSDAQRKALVIADNQLALNAGWDEAALAGLIRELDEELGIRVAHACLAPFVFASHAYDSFHLLMPLYLCRRWEGVVVAREHEAIAWVKPNQMGDYPMPPADAPLVAWLRDLI